MVLHLTSRKSGGVGFFCLLPIYFNHFIEYGVIQKTLCAIDVLAYQSKESGGVYFVYLKGTILEDRSHKLVAVVFIVVVLKLVVVFLSNVLLGVLYYEVLTQ